MELKNLAKPFPEKDIEWRLQQAGSGPKGIWAMCIAYIQARAIMDRLDEVCGPGNWKVEYRFERAGEGVVPGVIARIGIKIGDEWVWKEDGAEQTEIESFKGGLSSALKRAGSAWGIGRYLYDLEVAFSEETSTERKPGWQFGKTKDGKPFYWLPPKLPAWALPAGSPPDEQATTAKPKDTAAATKDPKHDLKRAREELMLTATEKGIKTPKLAELAAEMFGGLPLKSLSIEQVNQLHREIL